MLPGSFLGREIDGFNPGSGFVRIALVPEEAQLREAARRIVQFGSDGLNGSGEPLLRLSTTEN